MATQKQLSKDETIIQVVSELNGPALIDDVIDEVLRRWPTRAKDPKGTMRSHIRRYMPAESLLVLDDALVAPTGLVMRGVCFRVVVTTAEAEGGYLNVGDSFHFFWRRKLAGKQISFKDAKGTQIAGTLQMESEQKQGPWGLYTNVLMTFRMGEWFKKEGIRTDDSILVTVEDWDAGIFRLEREAAEVTQRRQTEIVEADQRLLNWLYDRLENSGSEMILAEPAVLAAHVQNCSYPAYPGSHWLDAMRQDGRMDCWDQYTIRYADAPSPFDFLSDDEPDEIELPEEKPLASEITQKVFTFYAYFKHNKKLWRRIEIQGEHDLQDFDDILRDAFGHDSDHLSGFWQRIRRGKTNRYREVDLATTSSLAEYRENAWQQLGSLDLKVGDQLKYVYDFGDWIEHTLELESISDPQVDVEYPRIAERNKPSYRNCIECKAEGKTTRAVWYCVTCTDSSDVLLCNECAKEHDDHYLEEIVY
ncbi:MAG: hypothetical protein DWI57_17760 [Chloroflexi bacterium]|nr:MAG: hypothetical protein DWI57_17760 [Chloroflexota bacterium]